MRYGNAFLTWLPLAVAITGLCLLIYTTVQQSYRQLLNDPQIQMAEDAAFYLARAYVPTDVVPKGELISISNTLLPWIAVYDEKFQPVASDASIYDAPPIPPQGVFESALNASPGYADKQAEIRVTWQPEPSVRQAIVVVHIRSGSGENRGYVVAGRNMREVEEREARLHAMIFFCWMVLMLATLAIQIGIVVYRRS